MLGIPHFNDPPILEGIRARTSRLFTKNKKVQVAMAPSGFLFAPAYPNRPPFAGGIVENDFSEGGGSGSGRTCCCECTCADCFVNTPKFGTDSAILSAMGITVSSCFDAVAIGNCTGSTPTNQLSTTINPNNSWSLTSGISPSLIWPDQPCCSWAVADSTAGTTWAGCPSGGPTADPGLTWILVKGSGFWKLLCAELHGLSGITPPAAFFIGTITTDPYVNCSDSLTFSNDLSMALPYYIDSYWGCLIPGATGGTAVVSFP